jgi:hypothetical protein
MIWISRGLIWFHIIEGLDKEDKIAFEIFEYERTYKKK